MRRKRVVCKSSSNTVGGGQRLLDSQIKGGKRLLKCWKQSHGMRELASERCPAVLLREADIGLDSVMVQRVWK